MKRLLIIDDDQNLRESLGEYFGIYDFDVVGAKNYDSAMALFKKFKPDIIFLDLDLVGDGKDTSGQQVLRQIRLNVPMTEVPIIVISGTGDANLMQQVLTEGANDYEVKPFKSAELVVKANRLLEVKEPPKNESIPSRWHETIIGKDRKIMHATRQILDAAKMGTDLLLLGESGVGKDLFARYYHQHSSCHEAAFVVFDCTREVLFEDRLFGHNKGAFNNAIDNIPGAAEQARGGILFFNEIGELNENQQATLLLLIDRQPFRKLGSSKDIRPDFIILAATNRDLEKMVKEKQFRFDLLQRIKRQIVAIPPLRDHRRDITLLAHDFIQKFNEKYEKQVSEIKPALLEKMENYSWPGNVRELELFIETGVVNCIGRTIHESDVKNKLAMMSEAATSQSTDNLAKDVHYPFHVYKAQIEAQNKIWFREYFAFHLNQHRWNKTSTAKALGIKREYLNQLLNHYGVERSDA